MKICSMTDIETVGTKSNTGILSISSIIFDYDNPDQEYLAEYTVHLDIKDQMKRLKRSFDTSTMDWWKKQDPKVYKEQFSGNVLLEDGLNGLIDFFNEQKPEWHWAKGTHFDMAILKDAMLSFGMENKFLKEFWTWQCCATVGRVISEELKNDWLVNNLTKKYNKEFGASHDPLVDCKIQIEILKDLILR